MHQYTKRRGREESHGSILGLTVTPACVHVCWDLSIFSLDIAKMILSDAFGQVQVEFRLKPR